MPRFFCTDAKTDLRHTSNFFIMAPAKSEGGAKPKTPLWQVALVSTLYMAFSILVVVMNKECFDVARSFPFPLSATMFQMFVALVCIFLIDLVQQVFNLSYLPRLNFSVANLRAVLPVSVAFIAMIATGNLCLSYLQISFFQTAKSLHIIFSLLFAYFFFNSTQSKIVTFWAIMVTVGWIISTSGEPSAVFSISGLLWGVASSALVALYPLVLKKTLATGMDSWNLSAHNSFLSIFLLFPALFFSGEYPGVISASAYDLPHFMPLMTLTALAGFLLNLAAMANVKYSSPLSHMIAGSCKGVVQSVIAYFFFDNKFTSMGVFGSVLCVIAIFGYSLSRYQEQNQDKKTEEKKTEEKKSK